MYVHVHDLHTCIYMHTRTQLHVLVNVQVMVEKYIINSTRGKSYVKNTRLLESMI